MPPHVKVNNIAPDGASHTSPHLDDQSVPLRSSHVCSHCEEALVPPTHGLGVGSWPTSRWRPPERNIPLLLWNPQLDDIEFQETPMKSPSESANCQSFHQSNQSLANKNDLEIPFLPHLYLEPSQSVPLLFATCHHPDKWKHLSKSSHNIQSRAIPIIPLETKPPNIYHLKISFALTTPNPWLPFRPLRPPTCQTPGTSPFWPSEGMGIPGVFRGVSYWFQPKRWGMLPWLHLTIKIKMLTVFMPTTVNSMLNVPSSMVVPWGKDVRWKNEHLGLTLQSRLE